MRITESLRKNADFLAAYRSGKSKVNRLLVLHVRKNGTEYNRLGVSVSKKVGNSVVRHRIRRLVKEAYRLQEEHCLPGYDLAVVGRSAAKGCGYREIEAALTDLLKRSGVFADKKYETVYAAGDRTISEVSVSDEKDKMSLPADLLAIRQGSD